MKIINNRVAEYHYRITDAESKQEIESTFGADAKQYIHGITQVPLGLAEILVGKARGDNFNITLSPDKAYGRYNSEASGRVPSKYVFLPDGGKAKGKLKIGTEVEVRTEYGVVTGSIIKQGLKNMVIDTNHPLAGKTLKYSVEIVNVRDATLDELSPSNSCNTGCGCC